MYFQWETFPKDKYYVFKIVIFGHYFAKWPLTWIFYEKPYCLYIIMIWDPILTLFNSWKHVWKPNCLSSTIAQSFKNSIAYDFNAVF